MVQYTVHPLTKLSQIWTSSSVIVEAPDTSLVRSNQGVQQEMEGGGSGVY